MRDPKRIPEILDTIHAAWAADPDLRLMQLLMNAINPNDRCPELYSLEDDKLLNKLKSG